ncbi:hypothetical protein HN587_05700 [Candidatus Woesearchaeota archaeon]|jgi:presenilin-like A22 family membrane protease|nr:hypothetical protein [Candidatus Woesearchaeota archaeon]
MKHSFKTTIILVIVFFIAQLIGLGVVSQYMTDKVIDPATGEVINVSYEALPFDMERPEVEESFSVFYIIGAVIAATVLILLIIKFKTKRLWKIWFLLSVIICLSVAFGSVMNQYVAFGLALILGLYKIFRPNFIIHNLTEVFIYGGLAAVFVPIMNLFAALALLVLISIYDAYAVWQSKHMIKMAKFQTESNIFAGLSIPYEMNWKSLWQKQTTQKKSLSSKNHKTKKTSKVVATKHVKVADDKNSKKVPSAILGGGDIGFPLIFAGVLMKQFTFFQVLFVPVICTITLGILLYYAQKNKFYPAMPFLSAGCLVAYGFIWLLF